MKRTASPPKESPALAPQKMPTGITGLDEITRGGLPRERNTVLIGGPGCGKTVLALQILVNGAQRYREPGIFVAFEENIRQIASNAATFGWNLGELQRKKLHFVDARMGPDNITAGDFDLEGFLAAIGAKARKMGAKRIVFDSIDVLLSLLDNIPRERQEVHRLLEWLTVNRLTGIITSKSEKGTHKDTERYGFLQFMADCAVELRQQTLDQGSQRDLRVIKYRGSAFAENAAPMVIGQAGIEVANISAQDRYFPVSRKRVSSGVERLDAMLGGGYYRGASVLITGAPGTAKSTLSGAFLAAACKQGERALYVSFDEIAGEHARNMASVSVDLDTPMKKGLLKIYSARTEASSLEEHLVRIYSLIRAHRARFVVFDPLSSLFRAGAQSNVQSTSERLLHMTKAEGITTISTSLLASSDSRIEGTPLEVSTIADTWIHLSYAVQAGERNRALTIVKSRGMKHSNQVRELLLSDDGVSLADVYTAGGEVLMGTMRWQREMAERSELERARMEVRRKEQEVKVAEVELKVRIETLRRELETKQFELAASTRAEATRLERLGEFRSGMQQSRGIDRESPKVKTKGARRS